MPEGENPEGAAAAPEAAHEEVRSNFGLFRSRAVARGVNLGGGVQALSLPTGGHGF